jgi:phosphate transport system protein
MSGHVDRAFDRELDALKQNLVAMGALVEAQVADALRAFEERDGNLARQVIEADSRVDRRELAIDDACIRLIALRHPAATDLRFIAASLKIVVDLERIGDLAVNMAERAIMIAEEEPIQTGVDLGRMATLATRMLRDALDAFVDLDAEKAERVRRSDREIDAMLVEKFDALKMAMELDRNVVGRALSVLSLAKQLERVADHATNVAEMVVFFVRGQDVRHGPGK